MLIHQLLRLLVIQEDGKPIVVVAAVRIARVPELPVRIRHLLLEADALPSADRLRARDIRRLAEVLLARGVRHPAVLLMDDGLSRAARRRRMVADPTVRPRHRLVPPVRVAMEDAEVDARERQFALEVAPVLAAVEAVAVPLAVVESALPAPRHEVVRVQALDVRAHLLHPAAQQLRVAVFAAREVAGPVCAAARLVSQLPREDRRRVPVAGHDGLDVAFVRLLDLRQAVELCHGSIS